MGKLNISFNNLCDEVKNLTHYQRVTLSICLCSFVTFANIYWMQPLIPVIQNSFDITPLQANLSMSAPLLGMGIGLLFFASLSDAMGRCSLLLMGSAAGLLVSLLLPFAENYSMFILLRFAQGACLAVCPAVAVPLLGDEMRKSWLPAAVGYYIACNTLGGISSRLIGGIATEHLGGWQLAAVVIGMTSCLFYIAIYFILPKQRHFVAKPFKAKDSLIQFAKHLSSAQLLCLYTLIGIAFGCFVNISNYLMIELEGEPFYLSSDLRSLMFLTLLGGTTSSTLAGKFSQRYSLRAGIALGLVIMLCANLLLSVHHLFTLILGMTLLSFGFFFCHSQASTLVNQSVTKAKGSAQALYSLFYYAGASLGVFVLEPFYQTWGWQGMLLATKIALVYCVGLVVCYRYIKKRQYNKLHA